MALLKNAPHRPQNSLLLFVQERKAEVTERHPHCEHKAKLEIGQNPNSYGAASIFGVEVMFIDLGINIPVIRKPTRQSWPPRLRVASAADAGSKSSPA